MFSNIGSLEILAVFIVAVIVIGPERLPGVVKDIRAAIFAARKAIRNARQELDGELGDVQKEFDSLREPISKAAQWGRLGPRGMITKALFDGDESAWDDFNLKKMVTEDTKSNHPAGQQQTGEPEQHGGEQSGGGFSYADIYPADNTQSNARPVGEEQTSAGSGAAQPEWSTGLQPPRPGTQAAKLARQREEQDKGDYGAAGNSWDDIT